MSNFLFQTSVISSRVYRIHDTNASGFGGVDLEYLQANMSGADVELAARADGGDLIRGPTWAFAWSNTAFSADFSCTSNLGASPPSQRHLVDFSLEMRGTQNVGISAFHAENAKIVENSRFLKKVSVTNQGCSEPDSVSAQKRAPKGQKGSQALLPWHSVEHGGWPRGCEARPSWVCIQILPCS